MITLTHTDFMTLNALIPSDKQRPYLNGILLCNDGHAVVCSPIYMAILNLNKCTLDTSVMIYLTEKPTNRKFTHVIIDVKNEAIKYLNKDIEVVTHKIVTDTSNIIDYKSFYNKFNDYIKLSNEAMIDSEVLNLITKASKHLRNINNNKGSGISLRIESSYSFIKVKIGNVNLNVLPVTKK